MTNPPVQLPTFSELGPIASFVIVLLIFFAGYTFRLIREMRRKD